MATVVQFGAGAIGRGFLAQLWTEAGYEVVFVDVDADLVAALNRTGAYPLSLVTNEQTEHLTIAPVRAISTDDSESVLKELAACAFAAVSIGTHVVETIDRFFLPLLQRTTRPEPLNVIVAENDPDAATTLMQLLTQRPGTSDATGRIAFIQAIVGRMVPRPGVTGDLLPVIAEPYKMLPVEPGRWLGVFPNVPGLYEQANFQRYVQKKLFVHNAGHAALAYHGYRAGHEFIWQCAADPVIIAEVRGFWSEVNTLLHDPPLTPEVLLTFEEELIARFQNRVLADRVVRVARDPMRKLQADDRLVWPALAYVRETGKPPAFILRAIAVALAFDYPEDAAAMHLQELVRGKGVGKAFVEASQCTPDQAADLVPLVEEAYNALKPAVASICGRAER
jgi:mannitol-1-phosphate 5-dehydrogenase